METAITDFIKRNMKSNEIKQYTPLLIELLKRDIKVKYRKSVLGVLWSVLNPLFMMIILSVVFSTLFKNNVENYPTYIFSGQLIYNFFSEATTSSMSAIVDNASLIKKIYVPKYLFVLARICSSMINLMATLSALFCVMLVLRIDLSYRLYEGVVALILLTLFSTGVGLVLSAIAVKFRDMNVTSRMYDIDVIGYNNTSNKLHLFDVESVDESIVEDGINFNKEDIKKNLTLFLYPDDSDEAGRILRIYQQYFMVSSAAQLILDECVAKGCNLHDLSDYVVIQINDTHPTMVIPELIRLLVERGLEMDEAIEVVTKSCAYTNHTILAEALEKWPIYYLKKAVPQLMPIIEVLDDKVRRKYHNQAVYIIDGEERVHMAHIDIHYSSSVNGVASLHTEILKNNELHHFYEIYPEKFNNKTNGITFRRWLLHCNPQLTELITSLIGDGFKKDATQLEKLLDYKNDEKVLKQLLEIKSAKKMELKKALMEKQNVTINENSIFDIQIKRLHEYKRQQLNALYVIHKYLEIKAGKKPSTPITVIFGAKAAPAYIIAQDIIHLILCLQQLINNDPEVSPYLNVVMVENYNVTWAEKLIPACDISEQISLASKEASGTGNMKFMLNGALTLGTEDGANVEIHELVGDDNIYIFGDSSDTVVERYAQGSYHAEKYYNENATIKEAVDFITGEELKAIGDKDRLERLFNELVSKDWFMTFPDFDEYVKTREQAYADYENREEWVQKMLVNIAKGG